MDSLIRFRVATEDRAKFEAAAERAGQSLSDWIRTVLLDAIGKGPEMVTVTPPKIGPSTLTKGATVRLSERKPNRMVVSRPDPDKIAEFQRKSGMAGGKGKR